jgi:hypothetical protein
MFFNYFQARIKTSFYIIHLYYNSSICGRSTANWSARKKLVEWNVLRTTSKQLEIIVFILAVSTCAARGKWQRVEDS